MLTERAFKDFFQALPLIQSFSLNTEKSPNQNRTLHIFAVLWQADLTPGAAGDRRHLTCPAHTYS